MFSRSRRRSGRFNPHFTMCLQLLETRRLLTNNVLILPQYLTGEETAPLAIPGNTITSSFGELVYDGDGQFHHAESGEAVIWTELSAYQAYPSSSQPQPIPVPGDVVTVPFNVAVNGQPTSSIEFWGNLHFDESQPGYFAAFYEGAFRVDGVAASPTTLLNDLDSNQSQYQAGDRLMLAGGFSGEAEKYRGYLSPGHSHVLEFFVDATTTVEDLFDAIRTIGPEYLPSIDAAGNLALNGLPWHPALNVLTLMDHPKNHGRTLFLQETTDEPEMTGDIFHDYFLPRYVRTRAWEETSVSIYDTHGNLFSLHFTFCQSQNGSNVVWVSIDEGDGQVTSAQEQWMYFDESGIQVNYYHGTPWEIPESLLEIQLNGESEAQKIELDFGRNSQYMGITQFGSPSGLSSTKDGFPHGFLAGVDIDDAGILSYLYSNGCKQAIGRIGIPVRTATKVEIVVENTKDSAAGSKLLANPQDDKTRGIFKQQNNESADSTTICQWIASVYSRRMDHLSYSNRSDLCETALTCVTTASFSFREIDNAEPTQSETNFWSDRYQEILDLMPSELHNVQPAGDAADVPIGDPQSPVIEGQTSEPSSIESVARSGLLSDAHIVVGEMRHSMSTMKRNGKQHSHGAFSRGSSVFTSPNMSSSSMATVFRQEQR